MVIGVFLGVCPTGGYYIEIKRIEKKIGRIVVYVKERRPDPRKGALLDIVTNPDHIVKLERSILPVVFSTIPNKGLEERIDDWIIERYGPMTIHIFGS